MLALLATRLAERGYAVWIIDPYGEYDFEGFETLYSVPDPFYKKDPDKPRSLYFRAIYRVLRKTIKRRDLDS